MSVATYSMGPNAQSPGTHKNRAMAAPALECKTTYNAQLRQLQAGVMTFHRNFFQQGLRLLVLFKGWVLPVKAAEISGWHNIRARSDRAGEARPLGRQHLVLTTFDCPKRKTGLLLNLWISLLARTGRAL